LAAFVADSPTATGLHAPGWRAVLSEGFAVKPLFLRVRNDAGRELTPNFGDERGQAAAV
jgi:hypothetical protein